MPLLNRKMTEPPPRPGTKPSGLMACLLRYYTRLITLLGLAVLTVLGEALLGRRSDGDIDFLNAATGR